MSTPESKAVYFLTGANRGIGFGLARAWLAQPNTTVIAAVRNPEHPSTQDVLNLPKAEGSTLILVKLDHAVESDPTDVVKELQTKHAITQVDLLIPNAGIVGEYKKTIHLDAATLSEVLDINVYAPLRILRAFTPLLRASPNPRFIGFSSPLTSFDYIRVYNGPNNAYIASKMLLGTVMTRLHVEEEWLTAFVINPGWVKTDMGRMSGLEPPLTVEESAAGVTKVAEGATREVHGGKQMMYDGTTFPWGG